MNIEKALDHFEWKFKNTKVSEKDIEAYNAILEWKELQEQQTLQRNESLAKLWIERFVVLSRTKSYTAERSINVIDESLKKSVYDWCLILKDEIPMLRFNSIGSNKYPFKEEDAFNMTKIRERNNKIIQEFETELTESLKFDPKEKDVISFVTNQINRIINTYEK
jgi:hypothetical protein